MTTFTGTTGNDILPLSGADNSGDDILYGLAGNDALYGGAGNDTLVGGAGTDSLYGSVGVDTASYYGATGTVNANLGSSRAFGSDTGPVGEYLFEIENLIGSNFNDVLSGSSANNSLAGRGGNDGLYGYGGNDTLDGGDGADTIDGGIGSDALYGGSGDDTLRGGPATYLDGVDYLDGGTGNDVLVDSVGNDQLVGGLGADRFVWEGDVYFDSDIREAVVRDFANGFDKIDLSTADANATISGVQDFTWLGVDKPFTGHAGELTFAQGVIKADLDGFPTADFEIQLNGVTTMSSSDFIL